MITVIDSGIANIGSVMSALRRIGAPATVNTEAAALRRAAALILPGVGAFGDGMAALDKHGLTAPIREAAAAGTPILGICHGKQLLAEVSEEFGEHRGLGLVPGRVVRLRPLHAAERVPNIGWCDVHPLRPSALFAKVAPGTAFYHVHSFHLRCADPADAVAAIHFGGEAVTVGVERGNVYGVQFHPEKSQDGGLTVLADFAEQVGERLADAS